MTGSHLRLAGSIAALLALASGSLAASPPEFDAPKLCSSCESWNEPQEPFRVFGNTFYVGTAGLASILITSSDGLILLDGALPQSAPLIAANIRKLGFRVEDIRLIVNSHTHYDHAGGIAALQRLSGAMVVASPASAQALRQGGPAADDPQFAFGCEPNAFPPVRPVRVVADNEVLSVGNSDVTARFTPGHTPGGTTWTWRSCEGQRCLDVVYADSLSSVSAPNFRFTGSQDVQSRLDGFRRSIERVAELPCDVLMTPHPHLFNMQAKLERQSQEPGANPFIDPQACKAYAAGANRALDKREAQERQSGGVEHSAN